MVRETCGHVLGGDQVLGARSDASVWGPGYSWGSQWRKHVGAGLFALLGTMVGQLCREQILAIQCSSWYWHKAFTGLSEVTQIGGGQLAPAHRQWHKLVETEPAPACQMGVCLAAHTTARSRQPPPTTDFFLQFKDDM